MLFSTIRVLVGAGLVLALEFWFINQISRH